jgi:tetratricopeptide (TPR) repeat protein
MFRGLVLAAMTAAALACLPGPALADMSACESASITKEPHERIRLWTLCIEKGGGIDPGNLGGALANRGSDYMRIGDLDKAMADFTASIQYIPRWAFGYFGRANIYVHRGQWALAEADLDQATKLDPTRMRAPEFALRAMVRAARGDYRDSIADDEAARKFAPNQVEALNGEAWTLATCPDASLRNGAKAVDLAQRAVKQRDTSGTRDTLAAAYAEAGDFASAQREQQRAIELLGPDASAPRNDGFKTRLDLYKSGMAFHTVAPPEPGKA